MMGNPIHIGIGIWKRVYRRRRSMEVGNPDSLPQPLASSYWPGQTQPLAAPLWS